MFEMKEKKRKGKRGGRKGIVPSRLSLSDHIFFSWDIYLVNKNFREKAYSYLEH